MITEQDPKKLAHILLGETYKGRHPSNIFKRWAVGITVGEAIRYWQQNPSTDLQPIRDYDLIPKGDTPPELSQRWHGSIPYGNSSSRIELGRLIATDILEGSDPSIQPRIIRKKVGRMVSEIIKDADSNIGRVELLRLMRVRQLMDYKID